MTLYLAIDTASFDIGLALGDDDGDVESRVLEGAFDHSRLLIPAIDSMVGDRRAQLAGVAVVRGPGSYAGLRVGIATATGIAAALGVPLRGVGTMEAIAAAGNVRTAAVIHPAGRGEYAVQDFVDGVPDGAIRTCSGAELRGQAAWGEGAAALGGTEVTTEARCRAALRLALSALEAGAGGGADAIYLREPNITLPRRTPLIQNR